MLSTATRRWLRVVIDSRFSGNFFASSGGVWNHAYSGSVGTRRRKSRRGTPAIQGHYLAFSPDGQILTVNDSGPGLRYWRAPTLAEIDAAEIKQP